MNIPMEIGSLLGTLVLAALVMGVVVMMPIAIGRNLLRGHDYRKRIDGELSKLRLPKMLGFLGIDKSEYLHKEQGVVIREQMQKCDACGDKELCDDVLETGRATPEVDLGFCANIDALRTMEKASD